MRIVQTHLLKHIVEALDVNNKNNLYIKKANPYRFNTLRIFTIRVNHCFNLISKGVTFLLYPLFTLNLYINLYLLYSNKHI